MPVDIKNQSEWEEQREEITHKVSKLETKGLSMIPESLRGLMEKELALGGLLVLDSESSPAC